ncbi:hypothetical protein HKD37_08G023724 [Glycine soja]
MDRQTFLLDRNGKIQKWTRCSPKENTKQKEKKRQNPRIENYKNVSEGGRVKKVKDSRTLY